jgi:hypothetical protein
MASSFFNSNNCLQKTGGFACNWQPVSIYARVAAIASRKQNLPLALYYFLRQKNMFRIQMSRTGGESHTNCTPRGRLSHANCTRVAASCMQITDDFIHVACNGSPVPEIMDTVFAKTSPKRSFSMTEYERFWLVFTKTRVYKFGHWGTSYMRLGCPSKLVSIRNNRNWNRN